MKRFGSFHAKAVLFVFYVMVFSGFLTGAILFILHYFGIVRFSIFNPLLLPLVALLASTILGLGLSYVFGEHVLKPVRILTEATRKVAKGDFSVRVPEIDDGDENEVAEFLRSFNKMAQELSGIEMFRNDFINNFSHEFKTPMVSIRGFAKQLQKGGLDEQQQKEYIGIIVSESERLINLSSNILLLTRYENQQIISDKAVYSLDEQIRQCILILEKEWSAKGIEFNLQLDSTDFYGNREVMSDLWINIIGNAIKFSYDGGKIDIRCTHSGNNIRVTVRDHGCGMDKETLNHIFEKFYQGDKNHAARGNGLGLALVKRIAELCGGYIKVSSEPGKGTEFSINLKAQGG